MVVLESMHSSTPLSGSNGGPNQYLQPDYLAPLPTTLDAKKSPLALLVQTCSQIGADTPSKFDLHLQQKRKSSIDDTSRPKSSNNSSSHKSSASSHPTGKASPTTRVPSARSETSTSTSTLSTTSSGKTSPPEKPLKRPSSSHSSTSSSPLPSKLARVSPPANSNHSNASTESLTSNTNCHEGKKEGGGASKTSSNTRKSPTTTTSSSESTTKASSGAVDPIIRSGLEVLNMNGARLSASSSAFGLPASSLSAFGYHHPHEPLFSPAFRHPFFPPPGFGYPASPAVSASAAAAAAAASPYVSYTRVKTPSGAESIVPVCKDPYCTGCQAQGAATGYPSPPMVCPAGCAQCDHQKVPYPFPPYPSSLFPHAHGVVPGSAQQQQQQQQQQRPHVCNWIVADNYCGKRFGSSEELLQHLRTHTQNLPQGPDALQAMAAAAAHHQHQQQQQQLAASSMYASSVLNPLMAAAAMQRGAYPPSSPYAAAAMAAAAAAAAASGKGSIPPPPPSAYYPSPYSSLFAHRPV